MTLEPARALADAVNLATKWVVIAPLGLWALWEVTLIVLRWCGVPVLLVSGVAKNLGYGGLAMAAYFYAGMPVHWFVNWHAPVWHSWVPGLTWWLVGASYLALDLLHPIPHGEGPAALRFYQHPSTAAVLGAVLAWTLFPQRENWSLP